MKTIPNKESDLTNDEKPLTYARMLLVCLDVPPEKGFDISTIRARLKVAAVLESATDTIALEDADFAVVKEAFAAMRWTKPHKDILALAEELGL